MPNPRRVLFLCTGNACRSQMAEAILRHHGGDRFDALSAGSHPAGFVHGLAVEALSRMNVPVGNPTSKSWDEFADAKLDVVITVCDAAAAETCPVWLGAPITAHWPMPDPTYHAGDDAERIDFACSVAQRLRLKIQAMIDLDWSMEPLAIAQRLTFLGEI